MSVVPFLTSHFLEPVPGPLAPLPNRSFNRWVIDAHLAFEGETIDDELWSHVHLRHAEPEMDFESIPFVGRIRFDLPTDALQLRRFIGSKTTAAHVDFCLDKNLVLQDDRLCDVRNLLFEKASSLKHLSFLHFGKMEEHPGLIDQLAGLSGLKSLYWFSSSRRSHGEGLIMAPSAFPSLEIFRVPVAQRGQSFKDDEACTGMCHSSAADTFMVSAAFQERLHTYEGCTCALLRAAHFGRVMPRLKLLNLINLNRSNVTLNARKWFPNLSDLTVHLNPVDFALLPLEFSLVAPTMNVHIDTTLSCVAEWSTGLENIKAALKKNDDILRCMRVQWQFRELVPLNINGMTLFELCNVSATELLEWLTCFLELKELWLHVPHGDWVLFADHFSLSEFIEEKAHHFVMSDVDCYVSVNGNDWKMC